MKNKTQARVTALQEKLLHASRSLVTLRVRGEAAKQTEVTLKLEASRREAEQREIIDSCVRVRYHTCMICHVMSQKAASVGRFVKSLLALIANIHFPCCCGCKEGVRGAVHTHCCSKHHRLRESGLLLPVSPRVHREGKIFVHL